MSVPKNILVVDDDPVARAHTARILADVGFACGTVASGREALARLERDREIAIVVSDVVLPELDGVRLGRFIRDRFPDRPWLQVIFVTGHAELAAAVSALRLGAIDYLSKPPAPDDLVFAVTRALAASRAVLRTLAPGDASPTMEEERAPALSPADAAARSVLDYLAALRRLRRQSGILADLDESSWIILLEVHHAASIGRRLSVSKLCALDEASQTTAWRRIRSMEQAGLLVRDPDPVDARRSFVRLTDAAGRAVADFTTRADSLVARAS